MCRIINLMADISSIEVWEVYGMHKEKLWGEHGLAQ